MEDPRFFNKVMTELTNIELYLQNLQKQATHSRIKSQILISNTSEQFVPLLINSMDKLQESRLQLIEKTKEMKLLLKEIDEEMYSKC